MLNVLYFVGIKFIVNSRWQLNLKNSLTNVHTKFPQKKKNYLRSSWAIFTEFLISWLHATKVYNREFRIAVILFWVQENKFLG